MAAPVLAIACAYTGATLTGLRRAEREKRKVSEVLARYLSPAVTGRLLADPERLKLGGKRKELTVLCVELSSFSEASERLEPEEVFVISDGEPNRGRKRLPKQILSELQEVNTTHAVIHTISLALVRDGDEHVALLRRIAEDHKGQHVQRTLR